jgi:hypothetical protein
MCGFFVDLNTERLTAKYYLQRNYFRPRLGRWYVVPVTPFVGDIVDLDMRWHAINMLSISLENTSEICARVVA